MIRFRLTRAVWVFGLAAVLAALPVYAARDTRVRPPAAAVATAEPLATRAGVEILKKGGNAFDAAVAISATLAVVEPQSSGLGGGGFWMLHVAKDHRDVMVDGRERAPLAATSDMYLDSNGDVIPNRSLNGAQAAGIPGEPAALVHLAQQYGRLPLAESLAPAIRLAREGFAITPRMRRFLTWRHDILAGDARKVFLDNGKVPPPGFQIREPDLANTLELIAKQGRAGFYSGRLARAMVKGVHADGGIWTLEDLAQYTAVERAPIVGTYHGVRVVSAPPPSSGGIVLMEMFNILGGFNLDTMDKVTRDHTVIEAMRLAYRDRARYLGDTDYVRVDTARLLSPAYADLLRKTIGPKATPSADLPLAGQPKGHNTTHFSVIDRDGNWVGATMSINYPFGCGYMAPGTGVVLNNEMDDFSAKPGVGNVYGLVGTAANAIAPGKRPLSSMSPTFLEGPHRVAVLGTPGGSRIITMVLLSALDFIHHHASAAQMVGLPRFHHQYLPDKVEYEPKAFSPKEVAALKALGYTLEAKDKGYGNMQVVVWDRARRRMQAASDPRGEGMAEVVRTRLPR